MSDELTDPILNASSKEFGGLEIDAGRAGAARVQRIMYPAGWRWSTHVQSLVGTDWCEHGHVGFLARGALAGSYPDGTTFQFAAPSIVAIDAAHDLWVSGDSEAVLIQFDFEKETIDRLGLARRI